MSVEPGTPTGFAGLPTEIITQIFSLLKYSDPLTNLECLNHLEKSTESTTEIQSLRLTCRSFVQHANPFLVHVVSCNILDTQSLERLERISKHPHLSQHVKVVQVRLGFYDATVTRSPQSLADYFCWIWADFSLQQQQAGVDPFARDNVRRILADWGWGFQTPNPHATPQGQHILMTLHREYKRQYDEQQQLRRYGEAIERVGLAMARMPQATRLVLNDNNPEHGPWKLGSTMISILGQHTIDCSRILELVQPLSWIDGWKMQATTTLINGRPLSQPRMPFDLVIDLPVAVHQAGVNLTALRILGLQIPEPVPAWDSIDPYGWLNITPIHPPMYPAPIQLAQPLELKDACKGLRVLEITPGYRNKYHDTIDNPTGIPFPHTNDFPLSHFNEVVEPMIASTSLRHVHLDCASILYGDDAGFGEAYSDQILRNPHQWANLEVIHIQNARIRNSDSLLAVVANPLVREVRLDAIYLLSFFRPDDMAPQAGWSYLLDRLSEEYPRLHGNGVKCGIETRLPIKVGHALLLYPPEEDEVEDFERLEEVHDLFEPRGEDGYSSVDDYIRGATTINPLAEANQESRFKCHVLSYSDMAYDLRLHHITDY